MLDGIGGPIRGGGRATAFCRSICGYVLFIAILVGGSTVIAAAAHSSAPRAAPSFSWFRQFGLPFGIYSTSVSTDGTGAYLGGGVDTAGHSGYYDEDAFIQRWNASGTLLWTRQFGTSTHDEVSGVAAAGASVYITGATEGNLPGQTKVGNVDVFLRKYDVGGNELWTRQFGSGTTDYGLGVAADGTGAYVVGQTYGVLPGQASSGGHDAFLRRYDPNGNILWTRQFGSVLEDFASSVALDGTGVYVGGRTDGTLAGETSAGVTDAYLRKYDAAGNELWTHQFGTPKVDLANSVAADGSGVYVGGFTYGTFPGQMNAGLSDGYLRRYDTNGSFEWTREFGTSEYDFSYSVAADRTGAYLAGETYGTFPGQTYAGGLDDAFLMRYDANGTNPWIRQFGTSGVDLARGVAAEATGVYVTGDTTGTFPGQNRTGTVDGFLGRLPMAPAGPPTSMELKHEAIVDIKALKQEALTRGDPRFVREVDQAERHVWTSLGYVEPFRPKVVSVDPGADVSSEGEGRDAVELTLGPSWNPHVAGFHALEITWADGVVTTIDLPKGWPGHELDARARPWVDAWQQDVRVESESHGNHGTVVLEVQARDASLGFSVSFDADRVANLSFTYEIRPWWRDGTHLDPKRGERVFDAEEAAVRDLVGGQEGSDHGRSSGLEGGSGVEWHRQTAVPGCRLTPSRWSAAERASLDKECLAAAMLLVTADEGLAQRAVDDAIGTPINDPRHAGRVLHEIDRARGELAKAHQEWDGQKFAGAIDHFEEAWEYAQRAIREAKW